MKFAVLADLHIGRSIPLAIADHRRLAFEKALTKAVDAIVEAGVDYVFICGDLFERRTLRPYMVQFTHSDLFRMASETVNTHGKKPKILVVRGNHDGRSQSDSLDYIKHPLADYLRVFNDDTYTFSDDAVYVVGLNYFDQIDQAYEKLAKPALLNGKNVKILMIHGFVKNYNVVPPGDSYLTLDQLADSGANFIFTGHYHKRCPPKKLGNGSWVLSPGSTEVYDFAEDPDKGFYIVDTEGPHFTWIPIEPLHIMKQAIISNQRRAPPAWFEERARSELMSFIKELEANKKQGYLKIKLEGSLSEGWPSDIREEYIREITKENPLLLWMDLDTLELNLPPEIATSTSEGTDVSVYFKEFGEFADEIRLIHGKVRDTLEEEASTRTGLLTGTQREHFVVDWIRIFEARRFRSNN